MNLELTARQACALEHLLAAVASGSRDGSIIARPTRLHRLRLAEIEETLAVALQGEDA